MKNNFINKCLMLFGLFLFSFILMPSVAAQADTSKEKQLNVSNVILAKGTTFPLRTYNVGDNAKTTYKSGDEGIASVNEDGVISARQVGDTDITVTIKVGSDSTILTCHVLVGPAAVSVKLTQSLVILSVDNTTTLNVILKPSNTVENAKFSSVTPEIVSVTPGGRASAKAYGFAELRAYINDTGSDGSQKYDSCGVIVTSDDNVSKLQDYFSQHTELDNIPEADLFAALNQFFNKEYDQSTSSSNLVSKLNSFLKDKFDLDKDN